MLEPIRKLSGFVELPISTLEPPGSKLAVMVPEIVIAGPPTARVCELTMKLGGGASSALSGLAVPSTITEEPPGGSE